MAVAGEVSATRSTNPLPSPDTTRAAVIGGGPDRVAVEERRLPSLGARDVLVSGRVVGICHSDLDLLDGHLDSWLEIDYPIVFGHEWSGDVLEVGHAVGTVRAGDRVTGCAALGDKRWFGTTSDGAAAQRFVIPAELLHPIPSSMGYDDAALVEPFACAYQGIRAIGGADPGDSVCVVGAGTIGLCALMATGALGASVLAVEPSPERRALVAEQMGPDAALDPKEAGDLEEAVQERLGGRRPDLVIEAAGAPAALASALQLPGDGGRVLFLGLCTEPEIPAALRLIQERDLRIVGSTGAPAQIWPRALRFLRHSGLDLSPLISATFPLADVADAFTAARDVRANLKVQIDLEA